MFNSTGQKAINRDQSKAYQRVWNARKDLLLDKPFWGTLALRLQLVEDLNCPFLGGTNGKILIFNPDKVLALKPEAQVRAFVAHEIGHPMYKHHLRREGRNKRLWNIAGDIVINNILIQDGFTLPDTDCIRSELAGKSTEEIYDIVYQEQQDYLEQQKKEYLEELERKKS